MYRLRTVLRGEHVSQINQVAFSPDGVALASVDQSGKLVIWSLEAAIVLETIVSPTTPLLSVIWLGDSQRLVCGGHDGTLVTIILKKDIKRFSGLCAHSRPIECLDYSPRRRQLVSGAHQECKIWSFIDHNDGPKWREGCAPPQSPLIASREHKCILVTAVQWSTRSPNELIIGYMHHGIVCWNMKNTKSPKPLWTLAPDCCSAVSLSPDSKLIAFSDLHHQCYVCALPDGRSLHRFQFKEPDESGPVPLSFLHGGASLAIASGLGGVTVRNLTDGAEIDRLQHADSVQILRSYYDDKNDVSLIATAPDQDAGQIYLWESKLNSLIVRHFHPWSVFHEMVSNLATILRVVCVFFAVVVGVETFLAVMGSEGYL